MNYDEAIDYIEDQDREINSDIEKFRGFVEFLGNPQDDLKIIHIAGTNGKGSTMNFLSHMLVEAGYKVGFFVSPYIDKFNERFTLNNKPISDELLIEYAKHIKNKSKEYFGDDNSLSFFEKITAIGFSFFRDEKCDFMLLETGIGGLLDVTNVADSMTQIIATIEIDHTDLLGETIEEIATHKAGIIKDDSLVFSMRHKPSVDKIIKNKAKKHNCELYFTDEVKVSDVIFTEDYTTFDFEYDVYKLEDVKMSMLGHHQIDNVKLALLTALELNSHGIISITALDIRAALIKAKWPGRLEKLIKNPRFFIDGAHNIEGIRGIKESLDDFDYDRLIVGLNIMTDKAVEGIIKEVEEIADVVILTQLDFERSSRSDTMEKMFTEEQTTYRTQSVEEAIELSMEIAGENDLIIFLGSLYLTGEIRQILKNLKK